jgi:ABC-type Fe3+/spermidine/putrescine transport system ATPase subunit
VSAGDLTLRGIGKRFGARGALVDVDLDVRAGATLVLLGTSGAGKTTLLRIIAGLETEHEGTVSLGERLLSGPGVRVPPEKRQVGMVFQALELWPHMTVAQHVSFALGCRPRRRKDLPDDTVRSLLAQVGLPDAFRKRLPGTLSGGEQQRVAIARTLAAAPEVILYDEPLANLDPDRRRALRALIRRLSRERGTTLVYVTHDPEEALELGDEIAVLAAGRLVERAAPQALYAQPRTLEGARALGPVTSLRASLRDGQWHTALGVVRTADAERGAEAAGWPATLALLRPEDIAPADGDGASVVVEDVVARTRDWTFRARLGDEVLVGCSADALEIGAHVDVTQVGPAALVPADQEDA